MKVQMRHVGLVVSNLVASLKFYEGLGFVIWRRDLEHGLFLEQVVGIEGAVIETAKLKSPEGGLLELLEYRFPKSVVPIEIQHSNRVGWSHLALTVSSVDEVLATIITLGGSIVNPPVLSLDGAVRVSYCHDLEGNLLELVEQRT